MSAQEQQDEDLMDTFRNFCSHNNKVSNMPFSNQFVGRIQSLLKRKAIMSKITILSVPADHPMFTRGCVITTVRNRASTKGNRGDVLLEIAADDTKMIDIAMTI